MTLLLLSSNRQFFFLLLLWLLWLELPKLCWIKVVKVGILVFSLIVKEMFSASHHWVWCYLWFYNIWLGEREREKFTKICKIRLLAWVLIDIYKYFASSLWELYFSKDYFGDTMSMSLSTLQKIVEDTSPLCSPHLACCSSQDCKMSDMIHLLDNWLAQMIQNLPANTGDARDSGLIPGLGRSSGEGNGNPFWYSCLENSMVRGT